MFKPINNLVEQRFVIGNCTEGTNNAAHKVKFKLKVKIKVLSIDCREDKHNINNKE